jgi:iron complex transport system permease protein
MLLAGVALSTAFMMLLMLMMASGDPRMSSILTWISGSTYNVSSTQALQSLGIMVVLLVIMPFCRRWLVILPLGRATASAVGMAVTPAQLLVLLLAATLTAAATLIIGPLSFVGLMAPHIASMLGFRRAMPQMIISGILGGILMILADWFGRMILFPNQVPAGLLATFIGAPYFIYLLRKQSR